MPRPFKRTVQRNIDLQQTYVDRREGHYAAGARANHLLRCESAVYAQAYDADKWYVPLRRAQTSWYFDEVFDALADGYVKFRPKLKIDEQNILLAGRRAVRRHGKIHWNGGIYKPTDYRGKDILIPDTRMWGWFQQRQVRVFKLNFRNEQEADDYDRVVFGTKTDKYTHYPEKYGFKGRRAIKREDSWKVADDEEDATWANDYETRLRTLNPMRGQFRGKWTKFKKAEQLQDRWDEINEESGLRVKHAPRILMINQFITSYRDFVQAYMWGTQGVQDERDAPSRARSMHVTDHEIYRMFSGKYRQRIINNTLFADGTLQVIKVGKRKNNWWNKNQISRWRRIKNQN